MFVRNKTGFSPVLARGQLDDRQAVLSLNVEVVFDIGASGELTPRPTPERDETTPPDVRRLPLWRGTSVTAFANVRGPRRPPYARTVRLIASGRTVDLAVYGDRRWQWRLGQWTQSEPEPFEAIPLGWEYAFGGTLSIAPHRTAEGLPHPGGQVPYMLNPKGRGMCLTGGPVDGTLLPNIEHPGRLLRAPYELTEPHGIAPCPDLVALRFPERRDSAPEMQSVALRMLHHAPAWLIFDEGLAADDIITLAGHGDTTLSVQLPRCPVRVRAGEDVAPIVRSVHLDADRRQLWICWGHPSSYTIRRAPRFIELEAA